MATEYTKHQVESKECQGVAQDWTREISLAYYYYCCWRDLIFTVFTMTDLTLVCILYTCTIVLMNWRRPFHHLRAHVMHMRGYTK